MHISVQSFGFKYGLPPEADLVWDVRFMPNPNYIPLREKTGLDRPVRRFVLSTPQARRFGKKFFALVFNSLPYYAKEGKSYLTIAIGCTGGRHRSVVMAAALKEHFTRKGIESDVHHRDIDR